MSNHNKHDYEELTKRDRRFGEVKRTGVPYKRKSNGGRIKERIEENDRYNYSSSESPYDDGGCQG